MAAGVSANDQPPILNTDQCFFFVVVAGIYAHVFIDARTMSEADGGV